MEQGEAKEKGGVMPSFESPASREAIEKIAERIDFGNDEMAVARLSKKARHWKTKVALMTLEDILRDWRRNE